MELEGIKVVELASVLAGPAVGMFFAELGAEVIKIENKTTGGDVTRRWKLPTESTTRTTSAYYASVNWGKQVLLLDLRAEADRKQVEELLKEADIVISNFKTSSAQKLGMSYEQLKSINPSIIYAQLLAFDDSEERPAFDVVLQAEAGFLFMNGAPGQPPVKMPVALIDLLAAHQLKEGILLALLKRYKTGKGSLVRTSLYKAALSSLANQASNWLNEGHIPQPMGTLHPNIAPYGDIFWTKDQKPIVLAVGTEKQFQLLCELIHQPELASHPLFTTNALRVKHRTALKEALEAAIRELDSREWIPKLHEARIPVGQINNMEEVFQAPSAHEMVLTYQLPDGYPAKCVKTVSFDIQ